MTTYYRHINNILRPPWTALLYNHRMECALMPACYSDVFNIQLYSSLYLEISMSLIRVSSLYNYLYPPCSVFD